MTIWPKNMNASTRNTQKKMFCRYEKNIGKSVTNAITNVIARAAPAAKSMCVWTRTAITTFLPITGTSRSPIGISRYLLLAAGEVDDPAQGQEHVHHDRDDYQDAYDGREGPLQGAVVRSPIQPRHRKEQDYKDRRHHHGAKRDQSPPRKEHEHLLVEEEEPLRPGHVVDGRRVRRLGQGRRRDVREHRAGQKD